MGKHEVARSAVFLDRDGVVNRAIVRNGLPYPPSHVEDFELHDDVAAGCARLKAANFLFGRDHQPGRRRPRQTESRNGRSDAFENAVGAAIPLARRRLCARSWCRAIFIQRGYEESLREVAEFTVPNFNDAVNALLRDVCL